MNVYSAPTFKRSRFTPALSGTTIGGIGQSRALRPRCVFTTKGISNPDHRGSRPGMSTYLALTFGTLLSSQGTEAAIGNRFRLPPGFPFVVSPTLAEAIRSELPAPFRAQRFHRSRRGGCANLLDSPAMGKSVGGRSGRGGRGCRDGRLSGREEDPGDQNRSGGIHT